MASTARLKPTPTTRAPMTIPATAAIRLGEAVMVDQAARMRFMTGYPHDCVADGTPRGPAMASNSR
jgi:hypothetical protein